MGKGTPTSSRTKAYLASRGIPCDTVERWIGGGKFKRTVDLFNFIDMVAIHPGRGIVGIQVTSGSNVAARSRKIRGEVQQVPEDQMEKEIKVAKERKEKFQMWISTGNPIEVWGWRKVKQGRGGREIWLPRIIVMHHHYDEQINPYEK